MSWCPDTLRPVQTSLGLQQTVQVLLERARAKQPTPCTTQLGRLPCRPSTARSRAARMHPAIARRRSQLGNGVPVLLRYVVHPSRNEFYLTVCRAATYGFGLCERRQRTGRRCRLVIQEQPAPCTRASQSTSATHADIVARSRTRRACGGVFSPRRARFSLQIGLTEGAWALTAQQH